MYPSIPGPLAFSHSLCTVQQRATPLSSSRGGGGVLPSRRVPAPRLREPLPPPFPSSAISPPCRWSGVVHGPPRGTRNSLLSLQWGARWPRTIRSNFPVTSGSDPGFWAPHFWLEISLLSIWTCAPPLWGRGTVGTLPGGPSPLAKIPPLFPGWSATRRPTHFGGTYAGPRKRPVGDCAPPLPSSVYLPPIPPPFFPATLPGVRCPQYNPPDIFSPWQCINTRENSCIHENIIQKQCNIIMYK